MRSFKRNVELTKPSTLQLLPSFGQTTSSTRVPIKAYHEAFLHGGREEALKLSRRPTLHNNRVNSLAGKVVYPVCNRVA